jgi:hypothetical protein
MSTEDEVISQFNEITNKVIDHKNNDGYAHRKVVRGSSFYAWLKRNNYPKGFQILCHNCNFANSHFINGCPHGNLISTYRDLCKEEVIQ